MAETSLEAHGLDLGEWVVETFRSPLAIVTRRVRCKNQGETSRPN
jgi:hypothetical protein